MKKIGIVVPIYNAELYLEKCISSILDQTYPNFELVLVNDGSTDDSGKICDHFAKMDERVHVIHQNNHGVLYARYIGLREIECDYATFVDADDWISKDTYKKISGYMEQGIDVISFRIIRYFDDSYQYTSVNNYRQGLYNKQQIEEEIYPTMIWNLFKGTFGIDPSLCNKVIKRHFLINELYKAKDLMILYGQDVAVTYPLLMKVDSLFITEENLYYHRQREGKEVAPYISDACYYKKLYSLYEYILKQCNETPLFMKQMDYFYAYSTGIHLWIYGDRKREGGELFPFDKIPLGSKIILYGASGLGQLYHEQFEKINYGIILAWVDRYYDKYAEFGVKGVECIDTIRDYDYIVIAVVTKETAENIKNNLINKGIEEDKIVWAESR